jgi:hypothetical protein
VRNYKHTGNKCKTRRSQRRRTFKEKQNTKFRNEKKKNIKNIPNNSFRGQRT